MILGLFLKFLIWIILPFLTGYAFQSDKSGKYLKPLFYAALGGTAVYLLLIFSDFRFKYPIWEGVFQAVTYFFVLMSLGYIWRFSKKKKGTKIAAVILLVIPSICIYLLISILSILWLGNDNSEMKKEFTTGKYTAVWEIEEIDNTTEDISVKIYKDVSFLPLLQSKIYEYKDWNTELDSVRLLPGDKAMRLYLSGINGNRIEHVHLE